MHNVKGLAIKIGTNLGPQIRQACAGTLVPESFLAALISAENPRLDPEAFRFDKAVHRSLRGLRNPLAFWHREWNGITQENLRGISDEALVDLATSFGYTQITGWWSIPLRVPLAVVRDSQQHLRIAVNLLCRVAAMQLRRHAFGDTLRIWNTGHANGRISDPEYVPQALQVMNEYRKIVGANVRTSVLVPPRSTNDAPPINPAPGSPANSP